jgi:hypothetical protein
MKLNFKYTVLVLKITLIFLTSTNSIKLISSEDKFIYSTLNFDPNLPSIQSLSEVIDTFFIKQKLKFDFCVIGLLTQQVGDIIDGVRRKLSTEPIQLLTNITIKVLNCTDCANELKLENPSIIFSEAHQLQVQNLSTFYDQIDRTNAKFLFYIYGTAKNLQINFNHFFLIDSIESNKIFLKTYDIFEDCGQGFVLINTFDKKTLNWNKNLENYEILQNFFGCIMFTSAYDFFASLEFYSIPYEVAKMVGRRLNFTVVETDWDFVPLDENFYFTTKFVLTSYGHFILNLVVDVIMNNEQAFTTSFESMEMTFLITPGDSYTNFEKLYLPFDYETWKFLFIVFICAFLSIFIINRMKRSIQDVIYGRKVRNAGINIVSVFFGNGLENLPDGNFARIILMTFTYFCLVIRCSYQGRELNKG